MSYIATSNDVSMVPDSCHCHEVPGIGRHTAPAGVSPVDAASTADGGASVDGEAAPPQAAVAATRNATARMPSSYNRWVGRFAVILIALALAACGRKAAPAAAPVDPDAWIAPCLDAIARAGAAHDVARARLVLDGCRPCGVAWDDVIAAKVP